MNFGALLLVLAHDQSAIRICPRPEDVELDDLRRQLAEINSNMNRMRIVR